MNPTDNEAWLWLDEVLEASPIKEEPPKGLWESIHATWTGLWTDFYGKWDEKQAADVFPISDLLTEDAEKRLKQAILNKLNQERIAAGISVLEHLDSQREPKIHKSELFGNDMEYYEVPINLIWNRRDELKRQLAALRKQQGLEGRGE